MKNMKITALKHSPRLALLACIISQRGSAAVPHKSRNLQRAAAMSAWRNPSAFGTINAKFAAIGASVMMVVASGLAASPQIRTSTSLQHKAVYVGKSASFTVTALGDAPLLYQWRLDGRDLPGQTNKTLSLPTVQSADEGDYTVAVSNAEGVAVSDKTRLWVMPPASQFIRRDYTNAAGQRLPYFFYVPTDYTPSHS